MVFYSLGQNRYSIDRVPFEFQPKLFVTYCSSRLDFKQNPLVQASNKVFISFLAPGQMKTQKEAIALKLKIDQLRELQEETRKKAREAEMIREGIPLNREEERGYKDRRFIRDDRGGGGGRRDDRGGRDDRRGILYRGSLYFAKLSHF